MACAPLASRARVVGGYYYGAGAAAPPARSISQMVTPVKGVSALINPGAAFGGSDAEDEATMKRYAPRTPSPKVIRLSPWSSWRMI